MNDDSTDIDRRRHRETESQQDEPTDWESVPTDPEPGSLGYETSEWERIPVADDDQVIFLPGNEEDLADDAFVVLNEADLCDLVTRR
jgi:hypothetical protein